MFSEKFRTELKKLTNSMFIKFDEPVQGTLVGPEVSGKVDFDSANNRYFLSSTGRFKFAINLWSVTDKAFKVLQGPAGLAAGLSQLMDSGIQLDTVMIEIKRSGSGKTTKYNVRVVRPLTAEEKDEMSRAEPLKLGEVLSWAKQSGDQIPF